MSKKGGYALKGKFSEKLEKFLSLIKSNRKVQIGLAILFALILVVVYFSFLKTSDETVKEDSVSLETNAQAYATTLEKKLENLLSTVKGAGEVNVAITLENGFEYVYATEESVKETSSGTQTTTSVVLVNGEPVLTQEIFPTIKGVLVTASGADNISVKLNLINAISSAVEVASENIIIMTRS